MDGRTFSVSRIVRSSDESGFLSCFRMCDTVVGFFSPDVRLSRSRQPLLSELGRRYLDLKRLVMCAVPGSLAPACPAAPASPVPSHCVRLPFAAVVDSGPRVGRVFHLLSERYLYGLDLVSLYNTRFPSVASGFPLLSGSRQ